MERNFFKESFLAKEDFSQLVKTNFVLLGTVQGYSMLEEKCGIKESLIVPGMLGNFQLKIFRIFMI